MQLSASLGPHFGVTALRTSQARRAPQQVLVLCLVAASVVGIGTAGAFLASLRSSVISANQHNLQTISYVLADQASRSFQSVDLLQTALIERLHGQGLETPDDFRRLLAPKAIYQELHEKAGAVPQLDALTVIDAQGKLVNFSRDWPTPSIDLSDRKYFQQLKANPGLVKLISEPVRNRVSRTRTLYLARAVTSSHGAFLGLILGAVQLSYFEQIYQTASGDTGIGITLARRTGEVLVRRAEGIASPQVSSVADDASTPDYQPADRIGTGDESLRAQAPVADYPMVIEATRPRELVLQDWRRQAMVLGVAVLLLEGVLVAGTVLILRQFGSQRRLADAERGRGMARAAQRQAEAELALLQEREGARAALQRQHLRFAAALRNMTQALCMFDRDHRLVVANACAHSLFSTTEDDVSGTITLSTMLQRAHDRARHPEHIERLAHVLRGMVHGQVPSSRTLDLPDGTAMHVGFRPMAGEGWLVTIEDITERRTAEARIAHMAHHDVLTGLPNRVLFHERMQTALARMRRGEGCAVLCLDLDRFKAVNDTLGHPVGDALLCAVSSRLLNGLRETDFVARFGGDEFAIIQSSVDQPNDAVTLAARLVESIGAPYEIDGHQINIGCSIGIAVVPSDGADADDVLKNADLALYRAKAEGRGRFRCFESEMDSAMQKRRLMELDLRRAVDAGELDVYYQPLIDMVTRQVTSCEALLRWNHPELGQVSPAEFVPLAEEIGLIIPIGAFVLRRACRDAMHWPDELKVAVNLSPVQFSNPALVESVVEALRDSGLPASRLELEVTESVMLERTEQVLQVLHAMHDLGVSIAMDDFGTGYSSLSYLRSFPFDKVKIDRSFISELGESKDCAAIVGAVTDMCQRLGMATTAEGVETEEQLRMLARLQCSQAQGFLFSRPVPHAEIMGFFESFSARLAEAA